MRYLVSSLRAGSLAFSAIVLVPTIASACPACFAASGARGLHAYYLSTMLLSTMPFLLIGLIAAIAYASRRRLPAGDEPLEPSFEDRSPF